VCFYASQCRDRLLTLQVVCSHLSEVELTDMKLLQKLHDALNVYYNYTGSTACFNISQTAHRSLGEKGWDFQVSALLLRSLVKFICHDNLYRTYNV